MPPARRLQTFPPEAAREIATETLKAAERQASQCRKFSSSFVVLHDAQTTSHGSCMHIASQTCCSPPDCHLLLCAKVSNPLLSILHPAAARRCFGPESSRRCSQTPWNQLGPSQCAGAAGGWAGMGPWSGCHTALACAPSRCDVRARLKRTPMQTEMLGLQPLPACT